ncbi:MAG: hypothetical protein ACJ79S_03135 [Gemmatimonadaceae bacterium]
MTGRAEGRRLLFQMVLAVVVLHAAAIALYTAAGIATAGANARRAFVVVWTLATFAVVAVGLRRINRFRRR